MRKKAIVERVTRDPTSSAEWSFCPRCAFRCKFACYMWEGLHNGTQTRVRHMRACAGREITFYFTPALIVLFAD